MKNIRGSPLPTSSIGPRRGGGESFFRFYFLMAVSTLVAILLLGDPDGLGGDLDPSLGAQMPARIVQYDDEGWVSGCEANILFSSFLPSREDRGCRTEHFA